MGGVVVVVPEGQFEVPEVEALLLVPELRSVTEGTTGPHPAGRLADAISLAVETGGDGTELGLEADDVKYLTDAIARLAGAHSDAPHLDALREALLAR